MSTLNEVAHVAGIQDNAEISRLESFFQNPEIIQELESAEKYRIRRYMWLIPSSILTIVGLIYLASLGIISIEIGDSGRYRPSEATDGFFWSFIGVSIVAGIIISIFRSKIEGAIKKKILTKLAKELYSKLDYDESTKYAFGDIDFLRGKGFLNSFDKIDKAEDSIGFYIEENMKLLVTQGYELQTSEIRGSGKNRKRVTTNHCYLLKVRFPYCRIPLENSLFIRSDESETIINGGLKYAFIGGLIGFMVGGFFSGLLSDGGMTLGVIGGIIGAFGTYFGRKWKRAKKRVILENLDFEKLYDVECTDPIGSRMIITPAFMDRLVRFAEKSKHKFEFIYEVDCFYIKWNLSGAYLEVNTWKKITTNISTYVLWYAQMKEILAFIFDMRMLYFSKTTQTLPELISPNYETMNNPLLATRSGLDIGNIFGNITRNGLLGIFIRR